MIWSGGTCHRWRRTCQHTLTSVATSSSETLVPTSSIFRCDQPTWSREKAQQYDDGDRRCPERRSCLGNTEVHRIGTTPLISRSQLNLVTPSLLSPLAPLSPHHASHSGCPSGFLVPLLLPLNLPIVKLGVWMEMLGPKSCEALASTCRLRRSLAGCLEFWRSGRSRRVRNRAEKKLKEDESELRRSRLLS